jgi:hypothetical protein
MVTKDGFNKVVCLSPIRSISTNLLRPWSYSDWSTVVYIRSWRSRTLKPLERSSHKSASRLYEKAGGPAEKVFGMVSYPRVTIRDRFLLPLKLIRRHCRLFLVT